MKKYNTHIILLSIVMILFLMYSSCTNNKNIELFNNQITTDITKLKDRINRLY